MWYPVTQCQFTASTLTTSYTAHSNTSLSLRTSLCLPRSLHPWLLHTPLCYFCWSICMICRENTQACGLKDWTLCVAMVTLKAGTTHVCGEHMWSVYSRLHINDSVAAVWCVITFSLSHTLSHTHTRTPSLLWYVIHITRALLKALIRLESKCCVFVPTSCSLCVGVCLHARLCVCACASVCVCVCVWWWRSGCVEQRGDCPSCSC